MDLHTFIFIGRSGCGKGTQAALLRERITRQDDKKRQILYVQTGDQYRQLVRGETFSSKLVNIAYEKDDLAPDFVGCWLWTNMLIEQLEEDMHLVFDGAPRTALEAQVLTTALKFYKREKPVVVYINVSNEWSEARLLARGRHDDKSLSKIDKRLKWFEDQVLPAVEYLKGNPFYRVIEIDGEQSIEKVHSDIIAAYDYQA